MPNPAQSAAPAVAPLNSSTPQQLHPAYQLEGAFPRALVSVCPPDAPVYLDDPALLKERGKAPARANEQGRFFAYDCHKLEVSASQVVKWNASLGAHLGRAGWAVVDIDVDTARLSDGISVSAIGELGDAPVRTSNGARLMLFYRCAEPIPYRKLVLPSLDGRAQQVEVYSGDRQVVVHGKHPSGRNYGWRGTPVWSWKREALAEVTAEQIDTFLPGLVEKLGQAGVKASLGGRTAARAAAPPPPQEDLRAPSIDALRGLPLPPNPPEFGWDDFVRHMYAYRAAGADDLETARELFDAWAAQHPRYDSDVVDVQWGKVERVDDARVGWSWLAEQAGYNTAQDEFQADPSLAAASSRPPPLVIDPADPLDAARRIVQRFYFDTAEGVRTLYNRGGVFWSHEEGAYREVRYHAMRARVWGHLEHAVKAAGDGGRVKPTVALVSAILDAMGSAAFLSEKVEAGAWLHQLPGDPPAKELIAVRNGLFHIPTRKVYPHTPRIFLQHSLPFDFTGNEPSPKELHKFFDGVCPGEWADQIPLLQEWAGYCLSGDTSLQKALMLIGDKRSGKGTWVRLLEWMLGRENCCSPTLAGLGDRFGLEPLRGKLLATVQDARFQPGRGGNARTVERLLSITGQDSLTIDRKGVPAITETLAARIVVVSNLMPRFDDSSTALASRFLCVRFPVSFINREDPGLGHRLRQELPSIMAWALEGLARLQARGYFVQPASGASTARDLLELSSPITCFLDEECERGAGYEVSRPKLYAHWQAYCHERGEYPGTANAFGAALKAVIGDRTRSHRAADGGKVRYYVGVRIRQDFDEFDIPGTQEAS